MKITRLTTYRVAPRWMFLTIETDEGITGWGKPVIEVSAPMARPLLRALEPQPLFDQRWQSEDIVKHGRRRGVEPTLVEERRTSPHGREHQFAAGPYS